MAQSISALPAPLSPWTPHLEIFAPQFRLLLSNLAEQLQPLLFTTENEQEQGEPDGWSEVQSRGSLERLLMSEWALLQLYPLEFARRLTQSDALYWKLSLTSPKIAQDSHLLLDAGPEQLGACRVVQMALLVVFECQAKRHRGKLFWDIAQRRSRQIETTFATRQEGLNRNSLQIFLNARSWNSAPDFAVRAFFESAAKEKKKLDRSRWMAGGLNFLRWAPPGVQRIFIWQESNQVVRVGYADKEVALHLPDSHTAPQLLTKPFELEKNDKADMPRQMLFSLCGHRLALFQDGLFKMLPVPNSPNDKPTTFKIYKRRSWEYLMGFGGKGRSIQLLYASDSEPLLWKIGLVGQASLVRTLKRPREWEQFNLHNELKIGRIWLESLPLGQLSVMVLQGRDLFLACYGKDPEGQEPIWHQRLQVDYALPRLSVPVFHIDGAWMCWSNGQLQSIGTGSSDSSHRVLACPATHTGSPTDLCWLASSHQLGIWSVRHLEDNRQITTKGEVVGMVLMRNVYDQPTLLDLREDRLWACQTEREWPLNLRVKPTDIVIHPLEPIIAYRSLDQLCLYSLQYQEHLYIGLAK